VLHLGCPPRIDFGTIARRDEPCGRRMAKSASNEGRRPNGAEVLRFKIKTVART
jgi:hypothetical protein